MVRCPYYRWYRCQESDEGLELPNALLQDLALQRWCWVASCIATTGRHRVKSFNFDVRRKRRELLIRFSHLAGSAFSALRKS